jgi:uncharacterized protein (DUF58 family)
MKTSDYPETRELFAPSFLAGLEDLDVIARWVVEGFLHGLHRSPYVGFSVEFASHRQYLPGDDLRHLNWKLYGRHDKLYVKQYDAETNVEIHLVLDVSRSMTAGEGPVSKFRYATMLAAALTHLAAGQRDAVGLTLFADRVVQHLRARGSPDHRMEILQTLAGAREHPNAQSVRILHEVAELMPRRGMIVVISDLYFESEDLMSALSHFRHVGHDVLVFHLLTPLERGLDVDGSVRFRDLETGEQITTQAHEIRSSYEQAVDAWQTELKTGCLARDIEYIPIRTDMPLDRALYDYLVQRTLLF